MNDGSQSAPPHAPSAPLNDSPRPEPDAHPALAPAAATQQRGSGDADAPPSQIPTENHKSNNNTTDADIPSSDPPAPAAAPAANGGVPDAAARDISPSIITEPSDDTPAAAPTTTSSTAEPTSSSAPVIATPNPSKPSETSALLSAPSPALSPLSTASPATTTTATPPPPSISPLPPSAAAHPHPTKRFASLNLNKKFLGKATPSGPTPTGNKATSGTTARPTFPSAPSRLLTGKVPSAGATSATPSPPLTSWARPSPAPSPAPATAQPAPAAAAKSKPKAWAPVPTASAVPAVPAVPTPGSRGRRVGAEDDLGDFPTAQEAMKGKRARMLREQQAMEAAAAHNQALLEELDKFKGHHLDPNAPHWDEMDDEDADFFGEVVEFGDGKQYKIQEDPHAGAESPTPEGESGPVSKEERFPEDFDRSWPAKSPTDPSRRALFNERSNRLEAPAPAHAPASIAPASRASNPVGNPAAIQRGRRPSAGATAGRTGAFEHAVPPHLDPAAAALDREKQRRPSVWDHERERSPIRRPSVRLDNGPQTAHVPARRLSHTTPALATPAFADTSAPLAAAAALPAPSATLTPADLEEEQKTEMHSAAERAKRRREQEEAERLAAQERARRKAAELEEKMKAKAKEAPAAAAAAAPPEQQQQQPKAILQRERPQEDSWRSRRPSHEDRSARPFVPAPPVAAAAASTRRPSDAAPSPPKQTPAATPAAADDAGPWRRNRQSLPSQAELLDAAAKSAADPRATPPHLGGEGAPAKAPSPTAGGRAGAKGELPTQRISALDDLMSRIKGAMEKGKEEAAALAATTPSPGPSEEGARLAAAAAAAPARGTERRKVSFEGEHREAAASSTAAPAPSSTTAAPSAHPPAPAQTHAAPKRARSTSRPPPADDFLPLPSFSVTREAAPASPPPAWKQFLVKLPKDSAELPAIPAKQLRAFRNAQVPPKGSPLSFDPPLRDVSPKTLSRDETLIKARVVKGVPVAAVALPLPKAKDQQQQKTSPPPPAAEPGTVGNGRPNGAVQQQQPAGRAASKSFGKGRGSEESSWRRTRPITPPTEDTTTAPAPASTAAAAAPAPAPAPAPGPDALAPAAPSTTATSAEPAQGGTATPPARAATSSPPKPRSLERKLPDGTNIAFYKSATVDERPAPLFSFTVTSELDDGERKNEAKLVAKTPEKKSAPGTPGTPNTVKSAVPASTWGGSPLALPVLNSPSRDLPSADKLRDVWSSQPAETPASSGAKNSLRGLADDFPSAAISDLNSLKSDDTSGTTTTNTTSAAPPPAKAPGFGPSPQPSTGGAPPPAPPRESADPRIPQLADGVSEPRPSLSPIAPPHHAQAPAPPPQMMFNSPLAHSGSPHPLFPARTASDRSPSDGGMHLYNPYALPSPATSAVPLPFGVSPSPANGVSPMVSTPQGLWIPAAHAHAQGFRPRPPPPPMAGYNVARPPASSPYPHWTGPPPPHQHQHHQQHQQPQHQPQPQPMSMFAGHPVAMAPAPAPYQHQPARSQGPFAMNPPSFQPSPGMFAGNGLPPQPTPRPSTQIPFGNPFQPPAVRPIATQPIRPPFGPVGPRPPLNNAHGGISPGARTGFEGMPSGGFGYSLGMHAAPGQDARARRGW